MKRILLFFIIPLVMLLASASAIALPVITTAGTLSVLSTTYGTASSNTSFTVSGASMTAGITVTAPAGYEVSTSAVGPFSNSILVGAAGTIPATTIYVRLAAASTPATYSGSVSCASSGGATTKFVATVASTVSKAVLTITGLTANNKVYDRTTTATLSGTPALSGIIGSDVVTLGGSATAVFSGLNVGSGLSVTVSGYTISGANAGNYTLTQPTGLTANITQKALTVTSPVASNKVYDGTTNATIVSGVLVGVILPDVVTLSPSGTFASANVGTAIPITVAITGANAGNYSVTQPGVTANITVRSLTITATDVSKIYGDILTSGPGSAAFTSSGLQNGETIGSITITYGAGAATNDAVGTYPGAVTPSAPIGGTFTASNYSITNATGKITVTPKTLTITGLSANNKVYDRTNAATLSGSAALSGVVGADVVTLGGSPTSTFASINVGTGIAVTVTGYTISGAAAGNYTLTQPAGFTANITAKALTIATPAASNKVYDGTNAATITGTLTGVISPDVVTYSGTGTFSTVNVGTALAVTSTCTLGGANAGNYTLTQPVGLTANITPKTLTITGLTASNKVYDGTTNASLSGSGALSGVIAGDVVNLGGSGTGTFASKNVATGISVTVSTYTISGAQAGNYTLTQPSGLTANITTASLTITATGPLKVTGFTSPVVTGSTTNFIYYGTVSGETVTSVTLTPSPTTSQTAGSAYTVTPSAAAGGGGFLSGNYTITYFVYNGNVAGFSYVWTGSTNTTWSTTTNWSPNGTPGSTDNVSIPATANAPNVTTSTSVNTVTITGNNTINISSAKKLTINNGFNVNSGVTANVAFAGASTSTILEFSSSIFANYGTFNLSGTGLFQVDNNGSYIYNSGTFTANGNATLYLQGGSNVTHALTNAGTFYAGTSGSNCNIEMDDYGSIDNSGVFYLGPTSLMYYYNDNAQFVIINNQSGGTFTLQSDATGSASVGEIPQGKNNAFTGTFNVERYFQGGNTYASGRWVERSYRIISSCVNTGSTVNGNYVYGLNYIVGATAGQTTTANSSKNAFITGCTGGSTSAGNPSVYLYNESYTPSNQTYVSGNFLGITNITNSTTGGTITASDGGSYSIPVGTGVLFFFRGAATNWATRTVTPYIAPENVTLTSTGNMNVGPYTFKDWYTPASATIGYTGSGGGTNSAVRGFNMLGNPYPCAIDWGTAYSGATGIVRTNVAPTIWVFNPVTYQYDTYLSTSATTGTATGNASRYIASGQGFIVQATTTSPSLTIDEYSKVVVNANATVGTGAVPAAAQLTGSNLLMGKPVQDPVTQLIRLKLAADSINYDDIVVGFNSTASTKYNTDEDAKYIPGLNAAEGLASFSADNVRLSINFLPLPKQTQQEIKLHVTGNNSGTYTFKRTELNAIPQIYDVWLMDKYKKDSLDMRSNKTYAFNINLADTSSFGNNRFSIVIRQNPVLGVHLINFTATKAAGASQIRWVTENEQNYTNFTVERSTDGGTTFNVLGGVPSRGVGNYSLLDNQPVAGSNMYRLKIEDLNNNIMYSNVITLIYSGDSRAGSDNIVIYPNPAKSTISLTLDPAVNPNLLKSDKFAAAGNLLVPSINPEYNIVITSTAGTVVKTETTTQKDWQANVSRLLPGTYIIQVINKSNNSLAGKGTFVKL